MAPNASVPVLEVVTPLIGSFRHCARCDLLFDEAGLNQRVHADDLSAYPPEWQAEWQRLSAWILRAAAYLGPQARVVITDARSVRGLWLWLRGVRRYPAFLLGRARLQAPADEAALRAWLTRHIGRPWPPGLGVAAPAAPVPEAPSS